MREVSTVAARNEFSTVVNRAAFGKERVILQRRGKAVAAVIPMEDLQRLQELDDQADIRDAVAARKEAARKGSIPLKKLKADLGL